MNEPHRATVLVSILGAVAVTLYAAWAAVQILVLNPLAAVPGSSLAEINGAMVASGEAVNLMAPLVVLGIGPALAIAAAWVCVANRVPPIVAVSGPLALLILGTPGYFVASFGPGMALADTFLISGGNHSLWYLPLYAVSALAFVAVIIVTARAVASARTQPEPVTI